MSERTTRRSWSLREQCRNRPHQLGKDNDFVILHPDALKTLSEGGNTDASHGIVEGIERVRVIQIVIDFSPGRRSGVPCWNSNTPRRDSTLSGVLIDGGIPEAGWARAKGESVGVEQAANANSGAK